VIPFFGPVRENSERPGKSLKERFLAEGRFLKGYGALELYRAAYIREIKRRLARKEGLTAETEILSRAGELWEKSAPRRDKRITAKALYGEPFGPRDFGKIITILKTILERI
jgi:hypothetical protein